MRIRECTPEELEKWDPTGSVSRKCDGFTTCNKLCPERPSAFLLKTPEEMLDGCHVIWNRISDRHLPYKEYLSQSLKVYGPQGGRYPYQTMMDRLHHYYNNVKNPVHPRVTHSGRSYLLRRIAALVDKVGIAQPVTTKLYRTYAASPTGLHKGDYLAETIGMSPFRHVYPTCMGQRYMRQSPRLIFMDANPNVRWIESILASVRNWLRTYLPEYFGAWVSDAIHIRPSITRALDHAYVSIETDYEKMDQHYSKTLAVNDYLPVAKLLLPMSEYSSLERYIEEAFSQPVMLGANKCAYGIHNLLSGQPITQDVETVTSVIYSLTNVIEEDINPSDCVFAVIGDDVSILIPRKYSRKAETLMQHAVDRSHQLGLAMQRQKCRIDDSASRFCRKVYYRAGRRDSAGNLIGAYPAIYSLNNIVNPERPLDNPGQAALADLQRLDNCSGCPEFTEFVQFVGKRLSHKFLWTEEDRINSPIDWWERVYEERWDPCSSQSYRVLVQSRIIKV